jgi:hypothetical protein
MIIKLIFSEHTGTRPALLPEKIFGYGVKCEAKTYWNVLNPCRQKISELMWTIVTTQRSQLRQNKYLGLT